MNEDVSHSADRITAWSRRILLFAAIYIVACIPAILIAEASHRPQWPFHVSQLLMCPVCAGSAAIFLYRTRSIPGTPMRTFARAALYLSTAWMAFLVLAFFLVKYALSRMT
jgi:hypothetical protein